MAGSLKWILVINCGSSSIKFALFDAAEVSTRLKGTLKGIGHPEGSFTAMGAGEKVISQQTVLLKDNEAAFAHLAQWLQHIGYERQLYAISHRIVQGGKQHTAPERVTQQLKADLHTLIPLAPLHLPSELAAIDFFEKRYPGIIQVCCFDTAFHQHLPLYAQQYPLPRHYTQQNIRRYGFHGLSYNYIVHTLQPAGKTIIAHLGNGASMAAISDRQSIDTTMGFTPAGGLVMGTRTGDIDPGVLLYLLEQEKLSPAQLHQLVNKEAGLLGLSGLSSDIQELTAAAPTNTHAAEALDLFCYQAKKFIGAMAAALGGLQTLVFTGGIGEHNATVRHLICQNMAFLGIVLDKTRNEANEAVISHRASPVTVRVIATNEEWMIAHYTAQLLSS